MVKAVFVFIDHNPAMHAFVRNVIGPEERLLILARLHWIYLVSGFLWLVALTGLGVWLDHLLWVYFGSSVSDDIFRYNGWRIGADAPFMLILCGGCGVMIFIMHAIEALASEIALTNQRIIYKRGLIFVEVEEIDLAEIRAEHVRHGLLGRFLGYGQLQLDSRFVEDIHLPAIKKPYRLVRAMHKVRAGIHETLDLDGSPSPHDRKAVGGAKG